MARVCTICNHPKRLEIDRELVAGRGKTSIAREYDVSTDSVSYHAEHHLSRQLCQAWEKKELTESTDMLAKIDRILSRAEAIYKQAYRDGKHNTALNALKEQRSTIELLAKISYFLHQAKAAELQRAELEREDSLTNKQEAMARKAADMLSDAEMDMLLQLMQKIQGKLPASYEVLPSDDDYDFSEVLAQGAYESPQRRRERDMEDVVIEPEPPKMTRNNPPTAKPAYEHKSFEIPDSGRSDRYRRILG